MKLMTRGKLPRMVAATALVASAITAGASAAVSSAGASSKATISVAYAADTTFDTIPFDGTVTNWKRPKASLVAGKEFVQPAWPTSRTL